MATCSLHAVRRELDDPIDVLRLPVRLFCLMADGTAGLADEPTA
jgi:hypothetical protein